MPRLRSLLPLLVGLPPLSAAALQPGGPVAAPSPLDWKQEGDHRRLELGSVHASRNYFNITFGAPLHLSPTVEYSTERPIRAPESGRWAFKASSRSKVTEGISYESPRGGQYLASPTASLEPGTRYHFVITVPANADALEQQYVGEFSTLDQAATEPYSTPRVPFNFWSLWLPVVWLMAACAGLVATRRSVWRRLAELYPAVLPRLHERSLFVSRVVVGRAFYKNTIWFRLDDTYLHVSGLGPFRLWQPTFSVPWSEISATPDHYPWGLWDSRVIRLTFARDPTARVLVWPHVYDDMISASGDLCQPTQPANP
jgi:hypothetical protein